MSWNSFTNIFFVLLQNCQIFLIHQIFFGCYKIRRLKVDFYIYDPRVYLLFDIQNSISFILRMFHSFFRPWLALDLG